MVYRNVSAMSLKEYGKFVSKEKMVVLPLKAYEDLIENLEILNNKKLLVELEERGREIERGDYVRWGDIKDEL
jgi:PHD/YefM family antitoxin component YafN of YafNO toxin-antitoxin module